MLEYYQIILQFEKIVEETINSNPFVLRWGIEMRLKYSDDDERIAQYDERLEMQKANQLINSI